MIEKRVISMHGMQNKSRAQSMTNSPANTFPASYPAELMRTYIELAESN